MSNIKLLTGWDRTHLQWASCVGLDMIIKHHDDIQRVAERFCSDDMAMAMEDIFMKGLQEFLDMCDMDDRLCETNEAMMDSAPSMPNVPTGKGGSI